MRRIVWSDDASDDIDVVVQYIATDSPKARLLVDRIEAAVDPIAEVPAGRRGRVAGSYEKVVLRTPYIVAYKLSDATLTVLRIIHGARDWPEGEWPAE